jgi:hypothetical protein
MPLAEIRYQELQRLTPEELSVEIEVARGARFASERRLARHLEDHGEEVGVATVRAYDTLRRQIKENSDRLFTAYYRRQRGPPVRQWVFARDNLMVITSRFEDFALDMTLYRAMVEQSVVDLDTYLRESEYGEQLVEVLIRR